MTMRGELEIIPLGPRWRIRRSSALVMKALLENSHEDDGPVEREYRVIVWRPGTNSVGERLTVVANSSSEARKKVISDYGEDCTITIWNEEAAERPRDQQLAEEEIEPDA